MFGGTLRLYKTYFWKNQVLCLAHRQSYLTIGAALYIMLTFKAPVKIAADDKFCKTFNFLRK